MCVRCGSDVNEQFWMRRTNLDHGLRKKHQQHHVEADKRTLSARAERERGLSPPVMKMDGWVFTGSLLSHVEFEPGGPSANEIKKIR